MLLLMLRLIHLITTSEPNVPRIAAKPTTAIVGTEAQIRMAPANKLVKPLSTALASMIVHLS